jgi:hypothetical protein
MKRKLVFALSLLALLCFAMVGQILGQTGTVGVNANDEFTYTIGDFWSSSNSSATAPADLLTTNDTQWYNVTVSEISASNVTTIDNWQYINGTDNTAVVVQDVNSGTSYLMNGLINIVGANLVPGDRLYPTGNDTRIINQTVSFNYGSSKRDTNAVVTTYPTLDSLNNVVGYEISAFYFDKATGVLAARSDFTVDAEENVTILILLEDTNLWTITQLPSIITPRSSTPPNPVSLQVFGISLPIFVASVVATIVIVVVVSAVLLRGRRRHKRKFRR